MLDINGFRVVRAYSACQGVELLQQFAYHRHQVAMWAIGPIRIMGARGGKVRAQQYRIGEIVHARRAEVMLAWPDASNSSSSAKSAC